MFWKIYVAMLISRSSFQKSSDIFVVNANGVSIYISGVSLIISVDSILILLFPVEFSGSKKVKALLPNVVRLSIDGWKLTSNYFFLALSIDSCISMSIAAHLSASLIRLELVPFP